jgi:hypothetical protein
MLAYSPHDYLQNPLSNPCHIDFIGKSVGAEQKSRLQALETSSDQYRAPHGHGACGSMDDSEEAIGDDVNVIRLNDSHTSQGRSSRGGKTRTRATNMLSPEAVVYVCRTYLQSSGYIGCKVTACFVMMSHVTVPSQVASQGPAVVNVQNPEMAM